MYLARRPPLPEGERAAPSLPRSRWRRLLVERNVALLGTTSFWEGVDVKGDALRLVVIEKLPFASPDDPPEQAALDSSHVKVHRCAHGGKGGPIFRRSASRKAVKTARFTP